MPVVGSQLWSCVQQAEQPHWVWVASQRGTQTPPTQMSPQPQGGLQSWSSHTPLTQTWPVGHVPLQTPLQPSLSPQAAPVQSGLQQLCPMQVEPLGQPQVPLQPFETPQLPASHAGVQHCWLTQVAPLGQPQVPAQPLGTPQLPASQAGVQ